MANILICDDEPNIVTMISRYAEREGWAVTAVFDGRQAIEACKKTAFDVIVMDIMMPKLSGFEVCETLKKSISTQSIMILMVTALSDLGDIERAVAAGCDDYLSKPVHKLELLKRVENMIKLRNVSNELERLRQYIDSIEDSLSPAEKPNSDPEKEA